MKPHPQAPHGVTRAAVLDVIRTRTAEKGYAPTIEEIAAACNLNSTSSVHYHLAQLKRAGLITIDPGKNRAIALVVPPGCCPACGQPRGVR